MKNRFVISSIFLFTLANVFAQETAPTKASLEQLPLFKQAQHANPKRYQFSVDQHVSCKLTPDGKSFYALWLPPNASPTNPVPIIVSLHGHGSWAFDEIYLWQAECAKRGFGVLALQWWFGKGEEMSDYYLPGEIYAIVDSVLQENKIAAHSVLLHGFSRGSANIYGVTAFAKASKNDYVLLTVANAGKASQDFPVNKDITKGVFGPKPFANTHWVTYAGALDTHPDRDGIAGMREAKDWVSKLGGSVELALEDPKNGHGGFHKNPENTKAALEVFERLLAKESAAR